MTAIAISGMGLTGVLRLTWVHDNLAHVLEHCETDEPSGTWTITGPRQPGPACHVHRRRVYRGRRPVICAAGSNAAWRLRPPGGQPAATQRHGSQGGYRPRPQCEREPPFWMVGSWTSSGMWVSQIRMFCMPACASPLVVIRGRCWTGGPSLAGRVSAVGARGGMGFTWPPA